MFLIHTRDHCMIKGDFARTSVPGNRRPWQILERHWIVPPRSTRILPGSRPSGGYSRPHADEWPSRIHYVPRQLTPTGFRHLPPRLGAWRANLSPRRVPGDTTPLSASIIEYRVPGHIPVDAKNRWSAFPSPPGCVKEGTSGLGNPLYTISVGARGRPGFRIFPAIKPEAWSELHTQRAMLSISPN